MADIPVQSTLTGDRGTVRDAALGVLRDLGLTTIFANPGSTEIDLLVGLPDDVRFVLGLHEGSVVGMATGWALARGAPALVNVHTTAGLGNAVSALATARVNRAPLVVIVGQQDRRHLAYEPFLTGHLAQLAGDYPVWVNEPATAQAVPGALLRAHHEALTGLGPALVIVPMDDWGAPAPALDELAAPARVLRADHADPAAVAQLATLIDGARSPALISGAGVRDARGWAALVAVAEHLRCPVFHEAFSGGAGFPQDHPLFAGHLPAGRAALRQTLAGHDVVLTVGTSALRQYGFEPGPLVAAGTRMAVITADRDEAHRSAAELVLLAPVAHACELLAEAIAPRASGPPIADWRPADPPPPAAGAGLSAGHVLAALAQRLPADAIVLEESPSSRPELIDRLAARQPLGYVSPAMGGLGFAIPAAIGLRMALPARPFVAIVGDGSSIYSIQALWSAGHYDVGAVFVIMSNGGYAVMDALATRQPGAVPWPSFEDVDIAAIARGFGCDAVRVDAHDALLAALDELVPTLATRTRPLLLEVVVDRPPR
jgi:benzoylformate decarboxylase